MIPHKKYIKRKKGNTKVKCDGCKKIRRVRNVYKIKNKLLCNNCRQKLKGFKDLQSVCNRGRPQITYENAINKVYYSGYNVNNYGTLYGVIRLPTVLVGKKFKLVEVKE